MSNKNIIKNSIVKPKSLYYKFGSTLIGYFALLVNSILVLNFALQRGNPSILMGFYRIAIVTNVAQMIAITVKFVLNRFGNYSRKYDYVNMGVSAAWLTVILLQFVVGTILFDTFRLDLLLIFILQSTAVLIILFYNELVDFRLNRKSISFSSREMTKSLIYGTSILLIIGLQFLTMLLPKLPPNIDDIFSPHRVLSYEYNSEEEGYFVTGVYSGLNNSIVIPLSYNGKPVVGISEGAIQDDGIISKIQIGQYNDQGKLMSNVRRLNLNSIVLNTITSIELPESITHLENGAISGQKIQKIIYNSNASFSLRSFVTPVLSYIDLTNTVSPVNVDFNNNMSLKVSVPQSMYNLYRETFFNNRSLYEIEDNDIIVVDFETGTDYYLESQFFSIKEGGALLNISSLKNIGDLTSPLILDTELYNENPYANDGFVSKSGHVLRGWYRSPDWSMKASFNDSYLSPIFTDTTFYAKWDPIKTIQLDWSNYDPYNGENTFIQYIDTNDRMESIKLPQLQTNGGDINRNGYETLIWRYNNQIIEETSQLYQLNPNNQTLLIKAEWVLKPPTLDYSTEANSTIFEGSNLTFVFDESQEIWYKASFSHEANNVTLNYSWIKVVNDVFTTITSGTTNSLDIFNYKLRNHTDSGDYLLTINATAPTGEISTISRNYKITIDKKNLDISTYSIPSPVTYTYNGIGQLLNYNFPLPNDISVSTRYNINGSFNSVTGPIVVRTSPYEVEYSFRKIGSEQNNYNLALAYSSIKIIPKTVNVDWTQTESFWNDYKTIYTGESQLLRPKVVGLLGSDTANFILSNSAVKNVGNYTSNIVGIDNTNYTVELDNIESVKAWSITPKAITVSWDRLNANYDGTQKTFKLMLQGLTNEDANDIDETYFSYNKSTDYVMFDKVNKSLIFSAKNAGSYEVLVNSFNNSNYSFPITQTIINVTQAQLSTSWGNLTATYTGEKQAAVLTITGFKNNDSAYYNISNISSLLDIQTNVGEINVRNSVSSNTLIIEFYELNANIYNIRVQDASNDNYTFITSTETYTINRKLLSLTYSNLQYIYNGDFHYASIMISGIHPNDLATVTLSDFESLHTTIMYEYSVNQSSQVVINYGAKSAGTYNYKLSLSSSSTHNQNYIISSENKQFTIAPRLLELQWSDTAFTYNGDEHFVQANITNLVADDLVNLSYSNNRATNVGTFIASVTGDNPNYITNNSNNHEWRINKKQVIASIATDLYTYDGSYQYFELVYEGFIETDMVTLSMSDFTFSFNSPSQITYNDLVVNNSLIKAKFRAINANLYNITLLSTSNKLNNYDIITKTHSVRIEPRLVEFEWNYTSPFIYDKQAKTIQVSFTNLCTREDTLVMDTISATYSNHNKTNAGNYTAKIESINNSNYVLHATNNRLKDWRIDPRTLDIIWNNSSLIFNAVHQQHIATATNILTNDTVSFLYTITVLNTSNVVASSINIGQYKATLSGLSGSSSTNYQLPTTGISKEYEILPLALTLTLSKTDYTYNGLLNKGANLLITGFPTSFEASIFNSTHLNFITNATSTSVVSSTSNSVTIGAYATNAGYYQIDIAGSNNLNYTISQKDIDFIINPRQVIISWPSSTHIYDGTVKSFTPTITNLIAGDTLNLNYNFDGVSYTNVALTNTSAKDAGIYTVSISGISNPNYTISGLSTSVNDGVLTKRFEIVKKSITLSYSNFDQVYNGNYRGVTFSLVGIILSDYSLFNTNPLVFTHNGDRIQYLNRALTVSSVNVGTYSVDISSLTNNFVNSNYKLDTNSVLSITYKITPATVSYTWGTSTLTYNGSSQSITASIATESVFTNALTGTNDLNNLTLGLINNTGTNAGNYTATVSTIDGSAASNYKLPSSNSKSWTINQRLVTLSWSVSGTYTYNGNAQLATLTIGNLVATDINNFSIGQFSASTGSMAISDIEHLSSTVKLNFRQTNAGNYLYNLSSLGNSNYTFTPVANTWKINQKSLTLTWSASGIYTYNGASQSVNLTISGLETIDINSMIITHLNSTSGSMSIDSIEKTTTTVKLHFNEINAGTYKYQLSSIGNGNYIFNSVENTWTIAKKALTLTWSGNPTYTYNGNFQTPILTVSGLIASDVNTMTASSFIGSSESSSITKIIKETTSIKLDFSRIDAGTYKYQLSSMLNSNYSFTSTLYTWTILPLEATILWSDVLALPYNGNVQTITAEVSNKVIREDNSTFDTVNLTLINNSKTNFGNYTATITSISNSNYKLPSVVTKGWSIEKISLETEWIGQPTISYDGNNHQTIFVLKGLKQSDVNGFNINQITSTSTINSHYFVGSNLYIVFSTKNVGAYAYVVNYSNINYTYANNAYTFEITPIELSMSWASDSDITYNGQNQTISIFISGFVNGDENSTSISAFNYSFLRNSTVINPTIYRTSGLIELRFTVKDVATYYFNINNASGNYILETVFNKSKKVLPIELTTTWDEIRTFTYNGQNQGIRLTVEGVTSSDLTGFVNHISIISPAQISYTIENNKAIFYLYAQNAGTYQIQMTKLSTSLNYTFINQEVSFLIEPQPLLISWTTSTGNISDIYDGTSKDINGIIEGFKDSKTYTSANFETSHAMSSIVKSGDVVTIKFSAVNINTYLFEILSIHDSNYSLNYSYFEYEIFPE